MPSEKRERQRANRQLKQERLRRVEKRRKILKRGGTLVVIAAIVAGIVFAVTSTGGSGKSKKSSTTSTVVDAQAAVIKADTAAGCPASPTAPVAKKKSWTSPPTMTVNTADTYTATVKTDIGSFTIALDAKAAPNTVNNFLFLADNDFYNCNSFHRVIPGFMDQTGDPTGTGSGGPGYDFANENVPKSYATGDVAMANSGGTDSNGSQFFVVVPGGAATLNGDLSQGDSYSLFGHVTSGMNVVEKINQDGASSGTPKIAHRILSISIESHGPPGSKPSSSTTTTTIAKTTTTATRTTTTKAPLKTTATTTPQTSTTVKKK